MTNTNKKWALVTGSSSGIGLAFAEKLADSGFSIILHGIEPLEKLKSIGQQLQANRNIEIELASLDLSDLEQLQFFITNLQSKKISPDVLINNAGFQFVSPVEDFPIEIWKKMLDVHLTAPFFLIQKLIPSMRNKKWGRIINISSVHGLVASAHKSAYVSAKHALVGLTKTVALETAGSGITVNAICPGWVQTPLVENQIHDLAKRENLSFDQAREKLLGEKQPSKNFVKTSDLAGLMSFIISDQAQNMTGSIITMDGGWTSQ
ncbi:MAG: 3-hydroxybutyrate dehydrogenase [Bdellovibrionales bacterium]